MSPRGFFTNRLSLALGSVAYDTQCPVIARLHSSFKLRRWSLHSNTDDEKHVAPFPASPFEFTGALILSDNVLNVLQGQTSILMNLGCLAITEIC